MKTKKTKQKRVNGEKFVEIFTVVNIFKIDSYNDGCCNLYI